MLASVTTAGGSVVPQASDPETSASLHLCHHSPGGAALFSVLSAARRSSLSPAQTFPFSLPFPEGPLLFCFSLSPKPWSEQPDQGSQCVPLKPGEEGKYFTEPIRSKANDSVETFNSFLAARPGAWKIQRRCVTSSRKSLASLSPPEADSWGRGKKENRTEER